MKSGKSNQPIPQEKLTWSHSTSGSDITASETVKLRVYTKAIDTNPQQN
jgi:hypothetical protein